jgi:hypothetical protein
MLRTCFYQFFVTIWHPSPGKLFCSVIQYHYSSTVRVLPGYAMNIMAHFISGPDLVFKSNEAAELLRQLNDVFAGASYGAGGDYLSVLRQSLRLGGEKEALDRLKLVRLALAKYFARCTTTSAV